MSDPLFSVADQIVIISGGSRGIGKAIAQGFAVRGARRFSGDAAASPNTFSLGASSAPCVSRHIRSTSRTLACGARRRRSFPFRASPPVPNHDLGGLYSRPGKSNIVSRISSRVAVPPLCLRIIVIASNPPSPIIARARALVVAFAVSVSFAPSRVVPVVARPIVRVA